MDFGHRIHVDQRIPDRMRDTKEDKEVNFTEIPPNEWKALQETVVDLPDELRGQRVFVNNRYTVFWRTDQPAGQPPMHWLSIKRNDREPIHDWRDLQRIKTELLGPDAEAVELYPAEDRLVDTANQYHLWSIEGIRWPFGFEDGRVTATPEQAEAFGAKQRRITNDVQ